MHHPATTQTTHLYVSTYCQHERHVDCRLTCKLCGAPCLCPCHSFAEPAELASGGVVAASSAPYTIAQGGPEVVMRYPSLRSSDGIEYGQP